MKVVLNQDVKGLGKKLQIVEVSEGYARNYLIPKKIAKTADNKAINESKTKLDSQKFKKDVELKEALASKAKIEEQKIEFKHKTGEGGKLFGSVTEKEIAESLNSKLNLNIDKKKVKITTPIKALGSYNAEVKIYEGVIAKVSIVVARNVGG